MQSIYWTLEYYKLDVDNMCGIMGYVGDKDAMPIVMGGLLKLEYRGYDSVGIAAVCGNSISIKKDIGRVNDVNKRLDLLQPASTLAMGHTRWATHGGVTKENSHPHTDCAGSIAVVHNGIVENYQELKNALVKSGHVFKSESDTEVIPHLIEEQLTNGMQFEAACSNAINMLEGTFGILVIKKDKNKIIAIKNGAPLVIGISEDGSYVASDTPAFLEYTKNVVYLNDYDMVVLDPKPNFYSIKNGILKKVSRSVNTINWKCDSANKGEFDHFMMKEIAEQVNTIKSAANQNKQVVERICNNIRDSFSVFFMGCGSSYYACLAGSYAFSKLAKKQINVILASEFPTHMNFLSEKSLIIAASQSGETYDVLDAIKNAKQMNSKVVSIVNVEGSSITRESNDFLLMNAGPEISVLATKSYTSLVALLTLLGYTLAGKYDEGYKALDYLSNVVSNLISASQIDLLKELAKLLSKHEHIICIGRGIQYATALEAALKIKEVSYIHAEAFAGGELKHGSIALIAKGTPCIAFASKENEKETISNAMEVKARGGYIIGVAPNDNEVFDYWINVPECGVTNPLAQIIPIQILAYQLAILKGIDPDHPRSLAKSVTVK